MELIEDIISYKNLILINDFNKATEKLREIIAQNKEANKNKKSNVGKILKPEIIKEYNDLYSKAQIIIKSNNIETLKDVLKPDLFDNVFNEIVKLDINPFLDKLKKEILDSNDIEDESNIKNNMEMLVSYNCFKNYKMENLELFLDL